MCNEKILIIDKDPELCDEVADFLWEEGFNAESASDEAGWHRRMNAEEYDIVLLDQKMAGPGGVETARELKAMTPGIRVFLTGARPFTSLFRTAEDISGLVAGTISKPYCAEDLREALKNV